MQYPRKIRDFNAYIDGVSYAGRATEATLPELKLETEGHRGAGMDAPLAVEMGMAGMQAMITLAEWTVEPIKFFGARRRMVLRPIERGEADYEASAFIASLGGRWSVMNFSDLKTGSDVPIKLTLDVDYFRLVKDGDELFEIDVQAGRRVIGGVDQLAATRRAMGI
ncbi:phage major tail tube protein [Profundibacterium mesophilum]|uniref:Phage tail tube protein FII n=1 Tax=Profundibacterium mesophilum KAUST100406-0324 TaxID=1037889 RepID=A0A921NRX3_9RHOB|nr:phage major tail tube protein [Profundibacterium mesophilum]KAF0676730.1 putative phage tail tube protein FII [Profundibacterium mesophilum KAUST100406-0324]